LFKIKTKGPEMKTNKFEIRNQGGGEAELLIYGIIGDYWEELDAKDVVNAIRSIDAKTINVKIFSEGGSVFAGLAIYNALMEHSATVRVKIDALAASIASIIAMAGETVEMPRNAFLMIHNPWMVIGGEEDDFVKAAEFLGKVKKSLVDVYNLKTGIDTEDLSMMMDAETWLSADEAVDQGFADIITGKTEPDKPKNRSFLETLKNFRKIPEEIRPFLKNADSPQNLNEGENKMNLAELKEKYPELYDQLFNLGVEAGKAEGAKAELARIQDVQAQALPGHEELVNKLAYDGKTTGPEAAVVILNAERAVRDSVKNKMNEDGIEPVDQPEPPAQEPKDKKKIDPDLPLDERVKAEWDADAATRKEFDGDFEAFAAYMKASEAGSVKTFGGKK